MLGSLLYLAALAAGSPSAAPIDPPKDGVEVISRMRERYLGKWYRTLTFVQKTTLPDGKVEKWYEAAELPGKLRIDIAPLEGKNTILFRNDSLYEFKAGRLTESHTADPSPHGARLRRVRAAAGQDGGAAPGAGLRLEQGA